MDYLPFIGLVCAVLIIIGGYFYFTREVRLAEKRGEAALKIRDEEKHAMLEALAVNWLRSLNHLAQKQYFEASGSASASALLIDPKTLCQLIRTIHDMAMQDRSTEVTRIRRVHRQAFE